MRRSRVWGDGDGAANEEHRWASGRWLHYGPCTTEKILGASTSTDILSFVDPTQSEFHDLGDFPDTRLTSHHHAGGRCNIGVGSGRLQGPPGEEDCRRPS